MGARTRIMTGLLLCASIIIIVALSCFASPIHSRKVFAGVSPEQDNSMLHTRGYYNSLPHMPVLAPNTSFANNRVMLTGSKARALVAASYAARHRQGSGGPDAHRIELRRNRLVMFGGYVEGSVHGAFGEGGASVTGNTLLVDDEKAFVRGTDSPSFDAAATGGVGIEARQNSLLMYSGTVEGSLTGGYGQFLASDNSVMMHGGRVSGSVYGGSTHSGSCFGNTVIMTGGTVEEEIVGGHSSHYGDASGNTVIFSGGKTGGISGSLTFENPAGDNTLIINGGLIAPGTRRGNDQRNLVAVVYGGHSFRDGATNNQIFLGGRTRLENCVFFGGFSDFLPAGPGGENADVISGNMLIIEEDYGGEFPAARNFESIFLTGKGVRLPAAGYAFDASVRRLNNYGALAFSGGNPAFLEFIGTEYASAEGSITVRYHARAKAADRIIVHKGALLVSPLRIAFENHDSLPLNTPVPVVEIEHASSMGHVNRRAAVQLLDPFAGAGNRPYRLLLHLRLGGADRDIWLLEKRAATAAGAPSTNTRERHFASGAQQGQSSRDARPGRQKGP